MMYLVMQRTDTSSVSVGSISRQRAEWCGTAHRAARQLHAHCAAVGACERGPEQRCAPCPDCAWSGQGEDGSRQGRQTEFQTFHIKHIVPCFCIKLNLATPTLAQFPTHSTNVGEAKLSKRHYQNAGIIQLQAAILAMFNQILLHICQCLIRYFCSFRHRHACRPCCTPKCAAECRTTPRC